MFIKSTIKCVSLVVAAHRKNQDLWGQSVFWLMRLEPTASKNHHCWRRTKFCLVIYVADLCVILAYTYMCSLKGLLSWHIQISEARMILWILVHLKLILLHYVQMTALKSANKELKGMMKTVKIQDIDVCVPFLTSLSVMKDILLFLYWQMDSLFVEFTRWDDGPHGCEQWNPGVSW